MWTYVPFLVGKDLGLAWLSHVAGVCLMWKQQLMSPAAVLWTCHQHEGELQVSVSL